MSKLKKDLLLILGGILLFCFLLIIVELAEHHTLAVNAKDIIEQSDDFTYFESQYLRKMDEQTRVLKDLVRAVKDLK